MKLHHVHHRARRWRHEAAEGRIDVRPLSRIDRGALLGFYREFEPLGCAQGLPPYSEEARRQWIRQLLNRSHNFGAFSSGWRLVGHAILAPAREGEAEVAYFVHQKFRRRGVATRLVKAALERAHELHCQRVWATVEAGNIPSVKLLRSLGFETYLRQYPSIEMDIQLDGGPQVLLETAS